MKLPYDPANNWQRWLEVDDFELEDWVMTAGVLGIVLTMVFVLTQ